MEIEVHYLMEYPADGNLLRERSFSSMQTKQDRVTVEVIATKLKCVYNQRRTYSRDVYMNLFYTVELREKQFLDSYGVT